MDIFTGLFTIALLYYCMRTLCFFSNRYRQKEKFNFILKYHFIITIRETIRFIIVSIRFIVALFFLFCLLWFVFSSEFLAELDIGHIFVTPLDRILDILWLILGCSFFWALVTVDTNVLKKLEKRYDDLVANEEHQTRVELVENRIEQHKEQQEEQPERVLSPMEQKIQERADMLIYQENEND
nr:unnamed protein product [Moritella viscosa]